MLKSTFYTLIVAVLLAIISIAGYLYAVVYVGGMGSDLSLMYQKSNDLTKEEDDLNSIKRVAQNADKKNDELEKYIISVPNEGSISFIKTLEDTAGGFGLKSDTTSIQIISDDNLSKINKEYLSVKQTITGPENLILSFVKKIELLPYNTKIKSYSTTKQTTGSSSSQQLDLEILVVKEK